jgi:flavin reductase (DIM6/NTAB) family NADH-FMN oxidoreductase RutF/rubredoxin
MCRVPGRGEGKIVNLQALHKISYGIYIVSSKNKAGMLNGQIANVVFQVTAEPPQVAVCLNKGNLTCEYVKESNMFTISVLSKDTDLQFIGRFGFKSGRNMNKFENVRYKISAHGMPIVLDNSIAYIEAKVINSVDVGTHTLFIGEVVDADVLSNGETMTYEFYHLVKKGKSPKAAPTYIKEEQRHREEAGMKNYRCKVCGYVYEPQKGDPENGISPGTPFEQLPSDWVCPVCGAGKEEFEEVRE